MQDQELMVLDDHIKPIVTAKGKKEKEALRTLRILFFRNSPVIVPTKTITKILKYIVGKMGDSNKQISKQAIQFCAHFFFTVDSEIKIPEIFRKAILSPIKDKNKDIRRYGLFVMEYMIKSSLKFYKFFLTHLPDAKDAILDWLKLIEKLMNFDEKFITKFDKKLGFPVILEHLINRKKIIREAAKRIIALLLSIH